MLDEICEVIIVLMTIHLGIGLHGGMDRHTPIVGLEDDSYHTHGKSCFESMRRALEDGTVNGCGSGSRLL